MMNMKTSKALRLWAKVQPSQSMPFHLQQQSVEPGWNSLWADLSRFHPIQLHLHWTIETAFYRLLTKKTTTTIGGVDITDLYDDLMQTHH